MNISNILPGLSDLSTLGKRKETTEPVPAAAASVAGPVTTGTGNSTTALREILARYDVTDISPNDFSKMIQQLHDKGAVSQQDMQQLSAIRVDLENAGADPDESINLVDFCQKQVQQAQTQATANPDPATQQKLKALTDRLDWIQKFAVIQAQPRTAAINAVG